MGQVMVLICGLLPKPDVRGANARGQLCGLDQLHILDIRWRGITSHVPRL